MAYMAHGFALAAGYDSSRDRLYRATQQRKIPVQSERRTTSHPNKTVRVEEQTDMVDTALSSLLTGIGFFAHVTAQVAETTMVAFEETGRFIADTVTVDDDQPPELTQTAQSPSSLTHTTTISHSRETHDARAPRPNPGNTTGHIHVSKVVGETAMAKLTKQNQNTGVIPGESQTVPNTSDPDLPHAAFPPTFKLMDAIDDDITTPTTEQELNEVTRCVDACGNEGEKNEDTVRNETGTPGRVRVNRSCSGCGSTENVTVDQWQSVSASVEFAVECAVAEADWEIMEDEREDWVELDGGLEERGEEGGEIDEWSVVGSKSEL
eukprot:comp15289_c0_seq1/m.12106 comp15289_c0_seq1/g.12106  ORF comp15289_c0_seq1/g.12106 comp15289_c0_seq1/m.12106 type:complete len:322 (-) comp15289_c0_seq1:384-1349(-)